MSQMNLNVASQYGLLYGSLALAALLTFAKTRGFLVSANGLEYAGYALVAVVLLSALYMIYLRMYAAVGVSMR